MSLLSLAVANNVEWCAAVCRGDDGPDQLEGVWLTAGPPVALFPDAVTRRPHVSAGQLAQLTQGRTSCWVKDSYADVDLGPYGFSVAFSARWIGRPGAAPTSQGQVVPGGHADRARELVRRR